MPAHSDPAFIDAGLRAGSIDSGAALMIADVVLKAMAELPGGRELLAQAMERKIAELSSQSEYADTSSRASLLVMRGVVENAVEMFDEAA